MTYDEFFSWISYYQIHPFDDLHRIYRPAAVISQSNVRKPNIQAVIDFLNPPQKPHVMKGIDNIGESVMKALGVKR